ncbi:MAG: VOC family protein [Chloroflexota bacterium]|nr:VOC family protein [Chloroflexota bacterium]
MLAAYGHSSFTVSDLERSLDFYVNVLGMVMGRRWERVGPEIEGVTGVAGARLKMASVQLGDFTLELIQYVGGAGVRLDPRINNVGAAHIAFTVRDIEKLCQELKRKGVRFYGTPTRLKNLWGGPDVVGVYISDPDGATIELVEAVR